MAHKKQAKAKPRNPRPPQAKKQKRSRGRKQRGCKEVSPYLRCALGIQGGGAKIPDGDTHHSVALEYASTITVFPVDGKIVVGCLPGLPGCLRLIVGKADILGPTGVVNQIMAGPSSNDPAYQNGVSVMFPDFADSSTGSLGFPSRNGIRAARVVKYDLAVRQTGAILNQGGVVANARVPCPFRPDFTWPASVQKLRAASALVENETYDNIGPGQFVMAANNTGSYDYDVISTYPGIKLCSATEACGLLGKGCGDWHETFPQALAPTGLIGVDGVNLQTVATTETPPSNIVGAQIISGQDIVLPYVLPITGTSSIVGVAGDFWTDHTCDMLVWAATNLPTDGRFDVKASCCLEVIISYTGSVYRPLVGPPAPYRPQELARVDKVYKALPPAVSLGTGAQSWWSGITDAVTGIAGIVGDMDIPVVSGIAKMGGRLMSAFR